MFKIGQPREQEDPAHHRKCNQRKGQKLRQEPKSKHSCSGLAAQDSGTKNKESSEVV